MSNSLRQDFCLFVSMNSPVNQPTSVWQEGFEKDLRERNIILLLERTSTLPHRHSKYMMAKVSSADIMKIGLLKQRYTSLYYGYPFGKIAKLMLSS